MNSRIMKKFLYILISSIILLSSVAILIMQQSKFGKLPSGKRLERIKESPNYRNGAFRNRSLTPVFSNGASYLTLSKEMLFGKRERVTPTDRIPSVKTDLLHLEKNKDILIWFGHSSYFIQIDGKRILVDPVFSSYASPFSFSIKAFKGTTPYTTDDIPDIDYLFITHDHWDHLDYETCLRLKSKTSKVICGLGVGEHLESWGFNPDSIMEMDWNEQANPDPGFTIYTLPARHFSGRGIKRNQTLWVSFLFQTPTCKLFLGGDGGYDTHFAEIGKKYGPIDLAILENGQYNTNWKYIHLLPDDLLKAFSDLNAKRLLTVHSSRFALSNHSWDEPLTKVATHCKELNIPLITPMIGEIVNLKDSTQTFSEWWKDIE